MSQTKIGFYGHVKQYHHLKAEIDQAILEVLESGSYVLGPQLVKSEEELAHYMGKREAVGVNSGTDALLLAFLGLGLTVVELALVILAVPPIVTNAYLAVDGVDRDLDLWRPEQVCAENSQWYLGRGANVPLVDNRISDGREPMGE